MIKAPWPPGRDDPAAVARDCVAGVARLHGLHAVHSDDWKAECELLGLLDPKGPTNRQRAKFSKYRAELVAANMVACEGDCTWIR